MQSDNPMEPQRSDRLTGDEEIDGTVKNGTCRSACTSPGLFDLASLFTSCTLTQRSPGGEAMITEGRDICLTLAS